MFWNLLEQILCINAQSYYQRVELDNLYEFMKNLIEQKNILHRSPARIYVVDNIKEMRKNAKYKIIKLLENGTSNRKMGKIIGMWQTLREKTLYHKIWTWTHIRS